MFWRLIWWMKWLVLTLTLKGLRLKLLRVIRRKLATGEVPRTAESRP